MRGAARRPGHDGLEDRAFARAHDRRVALEREVLHREHRRAREAGRDRVHEVREGRLQPAQEPRERPQHAQLLHARLQLDRAHAVRHEVGPAGDARRRSRSRGQRAQQLAHVRLVPGAVAAERVGVDDDHAASSYCLVARAAPTRPTSTRARGASRPRAARRDARSPPRSRLRSTTTSLRVDEHGCAACDLLRRAAARRHDGRAAGHRLEHRDPEALVQRRVHDAERAAVEPRELARPRPRRPTERRRHAPRRRPSPRAPATRSSTPSRCAASIVRARFLRGSSVPTAST